MGTNTALNVAELQRASISFLDLFELSKSALMDIESVIRKDTPRTSEFSTIITIPGTDHSTELVLKMECETPTRSFKLRGASYLIQKLGLPKVGAHLVIGSTGNHGISVAYLARGTSKVTVFVPVDTSIDKISRITKLGAEVVRLGSNLDEALIGAKKHSIRSGSTFVDSVDPLLVMGHSSLGTELFSSHTNLTHVFFPIGVGAGITGLALAKHRFSPNTKLIGVVPALTPAWSATFLNNAITNVSPISASIAEALRTGRPNKSLYEILRNHVDAVITVTEEQIFQAQVLCSKFAKVTPEPSGAVGLAGILSRQIPLGNNSKVSTIVCG